MVPPHARGCTLETVCVVDRDGGSPARAGMHPVDAGVGRIRDGFPRTRGDAPYTEFAETREQEVPPHARGCTLLERATERTQAGSPARAGMHPPSDVPVVV